MQGADDGPRMSRRENETGGRRPLGLECYVVNHPLIFSAPFLLHLQTVCVLLIRKRKLTVKPSIKRGREGLDNRVSSSLACLRISEPHEIIHYNSPGYYFLFLLKCKVSVCRPLSDGRAFVIATQSLALDLASAVSLILLESLQSLSLHSWASLLIFQFWVSKQTLAVVQYCEVIEICLKFIRTLEEFGCLLIYTSPF